ncbi:hypothetical protein J6590_023021 [Homalodisca vitripennis]|nr:hypothetical protein J6590_023021 [Homalodisca vitripennis]
MLEEEFCRKEKENLQPTVRFDLDVIDRHPIQRAFKTSEQGNDRLNTERDTRTNSRSKGINSPIK